MAQSLDSLVKQGEGDQDAVDLGDGIFMSRNIANSYLVTSPDGDVMINTGTHFEARRHQGPFREVSSGPLRVITFTQGHPDHVGGWDWFNAPEVETIAQANHADVREYWRNLHPFYVRRIMKLWGAFMDVEASAADTAARAGAHDVVHRQPRVRTRRPPLRVVRRPPAGRPPTRSWSGCPNTAPCSSAT